MWAVVLFVFFGAIVAIAFGAMSRGSTYEEDRARARAEKLEIAQEEWNKTSGSYGWVDKTKGVAHIPIHQAMLLEMTDLQSKKPMPAGPIATPAPAASPETAPQPGAAATPAAGAKTQSQVAPVSPTNTPASKPAPPSGGQP